MSLESLPQSFCHSTVATSREKAACGSLNFTVETKNFRFKKLRRKANTIQRDFYSCHHSTQNKNVSLEDRIMGLCSPDFQCVGSRGSKGNSMTRAEGDRYRAEMHQRKSFSLTVIWDPNVYKELQAQIHCHTGC